MAYYKYHIFFCLNQRDDNEQCCNNFGAEDKFNYMKKKLKSLNLYGVNMCRVNRAGCFNRCQEGPLLVIYPEETWYRLLIMKILMKLLRNILTMERKLNAY